MQLPLVRSLGLQLGGGVVENGCGGLCDQLGLWAQEPGLHCRDREGGNPSATLLCQTMACSGEEQRKEEEVRAKAVGPCVGLEGVVGTMSAKFSWWGAGFGCSEEGPSPCSQD